MKPPQIQLLLIAHSADTQAFVDALIDQCNRGREQTIVLETLLVKHLQDAVELLAILTVSGSVTVGGLPCNVVLVECNGVAVPQEFQQLREAIPGLPLLVLGDQDEAIDHADFHTSWYHAGVSDYLPRACLTSDWLRHVLLRAVWRTPVMLPASEVAAAPTIPDVIPASAYSEQLWQLLDKLFANIPVLICAFTGPDHVYRYANAHYLDVVGRRDVLGKPIREALPELEGQGIYELLDQVYTTGITHEAQEQQVWLRNEADGELQEFHFALIFSPVAIPVIVPADGQLGMLQVTSEKMIFVVALDVSERVNIRRQLQEAHAQLNALFSSVPLGLAFVDREMRFLRVNPALAKINGLPVEAHLGKTPAELVPELHGINQIMEQWREIIATGKPVIGVEVTGKTPANPDEEQSWEESWFPVTLDNKVLGLGVVVENVTERKRSEAERERLLGVLAQERVQLDHLNRTLEMRVQERSQQVQGLASELTLAEQRERHRIAQILHDHIQQLLYGIDFRIALLANSATSEQQNLLDEFREIVQEAIRATRTLAVDLSPPVLQGEGLVQALQWLAHQMEEIHSLRVTLDVQEPARLPSIELRVLLLQSVRELLFNVVKHAQTSSSTVYLRQEGDQLVVQVIDQGCGFDTSTYAHSPRQTETFGLFSIHERMQLFGGRLEISSTPGQGTRALLILPLAS